MHDSQCPCPSGEKRGWFKLVGRVFIGLIFLIAGFAKIVGFWDVAGMIAQAGLPAPALLTILAIIFEFGGALLLISGFHVRIGAWMLIVFTTIVMAVFHNPADGQMAALMKNLAIVGGLLYVVATGAGKYSLGKYNRAVCPLGDKCPDCRACSMCDCKHGTDVAAPQNNEQHQGEQHHEHHQEHQQW
ncbi:DoxX family protein [Candidatus Kaiserbacteria bacterium]|nr:DoxX family protein [Candidatus Kaiserbacteria bacterium]